MDRTKIGAGLIAVLLSAGCSHGPRELVVASKNFTEQVILGEIIAQHLETRLHRKVTRKLNLGGTLLAHEALLNQQIDLYPEYTGTALTSVLKEPVRTDAAAVLGEVQQQYASRFKLDVLPPLGINNGFAMVVRGPDARAKHWSTLSDAAKESAGWRLGAGYEFEQRPDGLEALKSTYGLVLHGSPKTMDLGLLYRALEDKQVDMIAANATDGLLSKDDLKTLLDDKRAFPPYELCVMVRQDSLQAVPGLREALTELSGKFSNQRMQELNFLVDGRHRPVAQVAAEFLKSIGL